MRFLLLALLTMLVLVGCLNGPQPSPDSKVTVGIQVSPAMTLVMVAQDKSFFKDAGVDVEIKEFTAGKFALQAFLSGSIDFAVSGEVPVALATLQGNPIRVVSQVVENTTNEVRVVAIKDGETTNPTDYFKNKKRKLATSIGGGPEFYTYEFLNRYKIANNEVEIISQKPEDMPASLQPGSVDAISIFDPFAFIAEKNLGDKAITFKDPELYSEFYVLNARPEQVEKNAKQIEALLKGMVNAGEFIQSNPEESKQILQKYTKLEKDVIDGIWDNFVFKPALTQKLLDYWNAQADWAKKTGKVKSETPDPNFREVIETRFLEKVAPDAAQLK
jgi:ABC-type nitrate/sulfonate/bicarbonate transport system substrate-binding protein